MSAIMDFGGKTVALDFDGVLHSYESGWTGSVPTDPPNAGALDFVNHLVNCNAKVIVYSSRAAEDIGYAGILSWLRKHGFPTLEVTPMKPVAVAYVDDRAVTFRKLASGRGNWAAVYDEIEALAHTRVHGESHH